MSHGNDFMRFTLTGVIILMTVKRFYWKSAQTNLNLLNDLCYFDCWVLSNGEFALGVHLRIYPA